MLYFFLVINKHLGEGMVREVFDFSLQENFSSSEHISDFLIKVIVNVRLI